MTINRFISVIAILFAAVTIFFSSRFEQTLLDNDYTGPAFFPVVCAVMLILLSILLFVTDKEKSALRVDIKQHSLPLIMFVVLGVYIYIMPKIGFHISTFLLICVFLYSFGVRKYFTSTCFAAIVSSTIFFVFGRLLTVDIPTGELPESAISVLYIISALIIAISAVVSVMKRNEKC